jgi:hypothetical protein
VTSLTRSLLSVTACAAALIVLVTGCGGATTSVAGAALSSTGASASTPPAGQAASQAPARLVYLAEGGSVAGTAARAPACGAGCQLSGDGTTSLWDMTWPTWNSAVAAGTGTEKLDDCTPNCAAGTLHVVLDPRVLHLAGRPPRGVFRRQRPAQPVRLPGHHVAVREVLPVTPLGWQLAPEQPCGWDEPAQPGASPRRDWM